MADTGGPSRDSGRDARVARLEADVAEIRAILSRLAPRIDEMHGFLTAKLPELATKAELANVRTDLKSETAELRDALKSEMAGLRTELKSEMAGLRTELKSEMAGLRTELKSEMAGLRLELVQRPTRRQAVFDIFAVVGLIGAVIAIGEHLAH